MVAQTKRRMVRRRGRLMQSLGSRWAKPSSHFRAQVGCKNGTPVLKAAAELLYRKPFATHVTEATTVAISQPREDLR